MTRKRNKLVRLSFKQYLNKRYYQITVPLFTGLLFFLLEHPLGIVILLITIIAFIISFFMLRDELK